jgi:MoaA/NifB/PqqE/SkfB family radical SAM enzyme
MQSRVLHDEFRPLLSYLFTEWKCNLDCHYCWAFDNSVKGMSEEVAKRSIDFLHSVGCRVTAIMGGEPLLRPKFIHKVIYYGSKKGFFMYLPTNGRLMKPQVIDWIADAGVAAVNLAVDCVDEKPGLPKALNRIRPYFEHLVKMQRRYGYIVVFNMNICRINMDDIKVLTEIAHDNGISTDYHINETPMIEQSHFKHLEENSTYLREEDYPKVDDLLDYLTEKNRDGYIMVNSKAHLQDMKEFMRGKVRPWNCRAGQNSMLIRTDGTIAPCFPLYSATYDWGTIENHKFDFKQLGEMKKSCNTHCLSTTQYVLGHYYNNQTVMRWIVKQALHGLSGNTTAIAQA